MKELKRKAMLYLQGMLDGLCVVNNYSDISLQEKARTELKIAIEVLKDLDIIKDKDIQQLNIKGGIIC